MGFVKDNFTEEEAAQDFGIPCRRFCLPISNLSHLSVLLLISIVSAMLR